MGIFSKKTTTDNNATKDKVEKNKTVEAAVKDKEKPAASMKDLYGESSETDSKSVKAEGKTKSFNSTAYRVLVKPLVTEKVTALSALNKYAFEVADKANKIEVAKAVEAVYGVKPVSVNIVKVLGKRVRYGRISGKRSDWKKAIVTLPEGKTIQVYEGV